MRKTVFILCLTLAATPAAAPALESQRDYIDGRFQPKTKRITFPGTPCSPCWGEVVSYTSFSSPKQTYDARRYDGHDVTLLIPVSHPREAAVTDRRLRALVDRLDILHASYRSLLGWEPNRSADPAGKQVFGVV